MGDFCKLEKRGNIFILTITGNDEHRLNPTVIDSIRAALRQVRDEATGPSALITTAEGKFFSNGYDLNWSRAKAGRSKIMSAKLRVMVSELINFPMPTIAAITGHASAAGFVIPLAHDYLLMRKDRGFVYMAELDVELTVPLWLVALIKSKVGSPKAWREMVLKATKLTAEMGVQGGIIDSAHDTAGETVEAAVKLGEELVRRNWKGQVYANNRRALLGEVLGTLATDETVGDDGSVYRAIPKL